MFRTFLIKLFLLLSRLGFRERIIRIFAYFPPPLPSYTLRDHTGEEDEDEIISLVGDKNSLINTQHSNKPALTSILLQSDNLIGVRGSVRSKFQAAFDEGDSLRYHQVSSLITEKEFRPYKIQKDEIYQQEQDIPIMENEETGLRAKNYQSKKMIFVNKQRVQVPLKIPDDMKIDGYHIKTQDNRQIALVVVQPSLFLPDLVFIHSHPNHPDLGFMIDSYLDMCYNLQIAVIGYDYAGYGQSEGQPSDEKQILEIQAVYDFAIKELQIPWNHIVIYGQSIGSGPSIMLASNSNYFMGGLIIHSGFMSGLRLFDPNLSQTPYWDLFPNIDYISYVNCPIFIIHGTDDEQVSMYHGQQLALKSKNLFKVWYCEKGGHNNIELEKRFRKDYFKQLRAFTKELLTRNNNLNEEQLKKQYRASTLQDNFNHLYKKQTKDSVDMILKKGNGKERKNRNESQSNSVNFEDDDQDYHE